MDQWWRRLHVPETGSRARAARLLGGAGISSSLTPASRPCRA
jgi:hypothetical protein